MFAEYNLPVDGAPDLVRRLLIGFDLGTGAWFTVRSWDGMVFGVTTAGERISGPIDDPEAITVDWTETRPYDDAILEPFIPSLFLRDLSWRPEVFTASAHVGGGRYEATVELPAGVRHFDDAVNRGRSEEERVEVEPVEVRFGTTRDGHLAWKEIAGNRTEITYAEGVSPRFGLADPAHGGRWRLVWWDRDNGISPHASFTREGMVLKAHELGLTGPDDD